MTETYQMVSAINLSENPVELIGQLADFAAQEGCLGLQDASLVLAETIREIPVGIDPSQQATIWMGLFESYFKDPANTITPIIAFLQQSELNIQMMSDEFEMLESQLREDANNIGLAQSLSATPSVTASPLSLEALLSEIENLADQAAAENQYGLQDANLLLVEALREKAETHEIDVVAMLTHWPVLNNTYREHPQQTTPAIIAFLQEPLFDIPMSEEEFALLYEQLAAVTDHVEETHAQVADGPDTVQIGQEQINAQIIVINTLADEAASDGLYGLQDANLMLAEALLAIDVATVDTDLLAGILAWPELVKQYRIEPNASIVTIASFLRHPALNIPMGDEEFAFLEEQLTVPDAASPATEYIEDDVVIEPQIPLPLPVTEIDVPQHEQKTASVSPATQELVDLLLLETGLVVFCLQDIVIGDNKSVESGLKKASEELDRFANAAKTADFMGLSDVCLHINVNLQHFLGNIPLFNDNHLELLQDWLSEVQDYLPAFTDTSAAQLIVSGLTDEQWPVPMSFESLAAILMQVHSEGASLGDEAERLDVSRKVTATDDDVSIALPGDVNQELLDILLQELPIHTRQFSEAVQRMQSGSQDDLDIAQRVAHTLKGSANTVGIRGIAELTHNLEDILIVCANQQKLPSKALSNALINAADCLEAMSEALMVFGSAPEDAKVVLQEILDWANRIDQNGLPDDNEEPAASGVAGEQTELVAEPQATQTQATMMRIPVEQIENLFRLSGENIILNGQAYETMRRMKAQLQALQTQFVQLQQLSSELEQLVDLKDLSGQALEIGSDFDALEMDQYNELHTASRRLVESAVDASAMNLDAQKELEQMQEFLEYQQQLMIDTQEAIMKTRLVPVATITPRLQRAMRQTCRLTGKQGDLILSGESLLIDSNLLNSMIDPLMHLLRNAIDHGIETTEERLAKDKPAQGRIQIKFEREGNNVLVSCRDDGRGLDFAGIRKAAEKRGVLASDQEATEEELKRFILRPNFSTRSQTTQTSGRGVGMDAVNYQVISLGGSLALHSRQGQGLTVDLRLPLPLSRSHALLAKAGNYRVAIATKGITQVIYSGSGVFISSGDETQLQLDGVLYPVTSLNKLLNLPKSPKQLQTHGAVLLVQESDKITAVILDGITDSLDIVIKNFGHYLKKIPGFMGAAIMGDGSVAPVLDMPELLRTTLVTVDSETLEDLEIVEKGSLLPTILVVDDSLSQRRALEQLLNDAGFHVLTARDGIEAANILQETKPDMVLTDLEMPRMNGIELTAHIRSKALIKSLPVIMITSRTTQKHRMMAEEAGINFYLVKPVREDDLLSKMQTLMEQTADRISDTV